MEKSPLPINIGKPATNALLANGIHYLQDLEKISEKDLVNMHGVGPKAIRLLKKALNEKNLKLIT